MGIPGLGPVAVMVRPGREEAMAADPQCGCCKWPLGPGWLYLVMHSCGHAETVDDDTVFITCPTNAHASIRSTLRCPDGCSANALRGFVLGICGAPPGSGDQ